MLIKIGTRGSKLALWQAEFVADRLKASGAEVEINIIHTKGDKILDRSLSKIGSKGVFTEELEAQLLDGQIDIAVHSAKDLQSSLGSNLEIIAFAEREKENDVLLSHKRVSLNDNITIGTSSTRRIAMLKAFNPNIRIVDMRGNLQTRIQKMKNGDCDALILAYAGVHRMNYHNMIQEELSIDLYTPPVGQGSVAIEASESLEKSKKQLIRKSINHIETEQCLLAERAFLKAVDGGCSIPVFGNAQLNSDGSIELKAGIISLDGKEKIRISQKGELAKELGEKVAKTLLNQGGKSILEKIRTEI